uniref:Uncharacterized protein n=1 Tax=Staphylococcus aureus TaxID=1280 RepID=Q7X3R2_STAAU|nr:unknown [Staphylococcus aureus]
MPTCKSSSFTILVLLVLLKNIDKIRLTNPYENSLLIFSNEVWFCCKVKNHIIYIQKNETLIKLNGTTSY